MDYRFTVIIAVLAVMFVSCSVNEKELRKTRAMVDSLQSVVAQQEAEISALREVANKPVEENTWYNPKTDGRVFLKQNISDPASFIKKSLRNRPDLIPLEPVLGGRMHFGNMQLLGSQWIIAEYEDGHIMGQSLYEYTLGPDGEVQFSILVSARQ